MLCDSIGAVYPFILSPGDGHVRSNGCGPCASLHPGPSSPGVSGADGSAHPLNRRCDLYRPHYGADIPGPERKRVDRERMVRFRLRQRWGNLSDPEAEETVRDAAVRRQLAGSGRVEPGAG